ncbi:SDR family NAD(P)-dependent oxidoreductase [Metabacillus litoralis]|uniref:SDR family NAD(P)-dependent oxidoreductase n=1 Tax=Metabacillus litoralis TaxID=152268 RepID=UPI00203CBAD5|nr:glucose 1-dehydrogenase [Metabacillus litoralis]MCM3160768.1 glucose 1-dehydrogenase [Metabacillus litoralis]
MRLKGKVSIITGGSQGIGEATAKKLGEHGSKVVIADINEEKGLQTVEKLKEDDIDVIFIQTDVSNEKSVINLMKKSVEHYGGIDSLVNNAAATMRKSAMDTTLEEWKKVIDVNLTGTFLCSKYAVPEIAKRGAGSIVNMASWHAYRTITRFAAYAASKGGMTALTRQMALDCGPLNIRVNAVCPSTVDTPMLYESFKSLPDPEEAFSQSLAYQPLGRIATGEDIANACLFLISDESNYISGHSLMVDGGTFNKVARPLMFD